VGGRGLFYFIGGKKMRETKSYIIYKGKEYPIVFNLNVMEVIQDEYKSLEAWGKLTDGSNEQEVNIKALIFGLGAMLNEGIEINNDETGANEPLLTHKQVGRILTEVGVKDTADTMNKLVINSTQTDEDKEKAKNA
jgi:hypothetical protein